MSLITIQYGSLASSEVMNDNFEYLDDRITTLANNLSSTSSSLYSNITSMNTSLTQKDEEFEDDIEQLESDLECLQSSFDNKNDAPDYTLGISINVLPYTITDDGYINVAISALNGTAALYINGIKIGHAYSSNATYYSMLSGQYRVCKGDVVSYAGYSFQWATFYPLKGES